MEIDEFLELSPPTRKAMCKRCPFRRDSVPGDTGPMSGAEWVELAHGEGPMACHETLPPGGGWDVDVQQCRGMATFRGNIMKLPRTDIIERGEPDHKAVFSWNDEMIAHHDGENKVTEHDRRY